MKANFELRAMARAQLKGSWLAAVGMLIVYSIIVGLSPFIVIGPIILCGPLLLGYSGYFLKKARGGTASLENLFDGFKQFFPSFILFLLETIFLTLWSFLFIIPGIVKSFSYSMAFYIMKDNPAVGASEAITQSRKMMNGYKGKLFLLQLSFIGWGILCCLSFGIGFLWLIPYISASLTNFYNELKAQNPALISTTAVPEQIPDEVSTGRPFFCDECGAKNDGGAKFCNSCGKPIALLGVNDRISQEKALTKEE